jgi:hypothetical protein
LVCNKLNVKIFLRWGFVSHSSKLQPWGPPLSAVCNCLFNIFAATVRIQRLPPSCASWGSAIPCWQGPTYHGNITVTLWNEDKLYNVECLLSRECNIIHFLQIPTYAETADRIYRLHWQPLLHNSTACYSRCWKWPSSNSLTFLALGKRYIKNFVKFFPDNFRYCAPDLSYARVLPVPAGKFGNSYLK